MSIPTSKQLYHFRGLSTERKPIPADMGSGSTFIETDTGAEFVYNSNSNAWTKVGNDYKIVDTATTIGILEIKKTSTSKDGKTDIYTITYTNGAKTTFEVPSVAVYNKLVQDLKSETERAEAKEKYLNGLINRAVETLSKAIEAESKEARENETILDTKIDGVYTELTAADEALNAKIDTTKAAIEALIESTKNFLEAEMDAADAALNLLISKETARALVEEQSIKDGLRKETARAKKAEAEMTGDLEEKIKAEATRATSEEARLETKFGTQVAETNARLDAEIERSTTKDDEHTAQMWGDKTPEDYKNKPLAELITDETVRAIKEEQHIIHHAIIEQAARKAADEQLQANIDATNETLNQEITDRTAITNDLYAVKADRNNPDQEIVAKHIVTGTVKVNDKVIEGINVEGTTNIHGDVNIIATADEDGSLIVDGDINTKSNAIIDKNLTVKQQTRFVGGVMAESSLKAADEAMFLKKTTVKGELVTADVSTTGNVTVSNGSAADEVTNIYDNVKITKDEVIVGKATTIEQLTIKENLKVTNDLTVEGYSTLNNGLKVVNDAIIEGHVNIAPNNNIPSNLTVSGDATINQDLVVNKTTKINDTLTVDKDATFATKVITPEITSKTNKVTANADVAIDGNIITNGKIIKVDTDANKYEIKLQDKIGTLALTSDVKAAYDDLEVALKTEQGVRAQADSALDTKIDTEIAERKTAVKDEETARNAAIKAAVDQEVIDRNKAIADTTAVIKNKIGPTLYEDTSKTVQSEVARLDKAVADEAHLRDDAIKDKIGTTLYASTDTVEKAINDEIAARKQAIEDLDYPQVTLSKDTTIATVSETNGKIAVTTQAIQIAESQVTGLETDLKNITDLIPAAATTSNQLADKKYVTDTIATATAEFKGTIISKSNETEATWLNAIKTAFPAANENDYAFVDVRYVDGTGAAADQSMAFRRYKYTTKDNWKYEYTLNNSSFTTDQWAAINSGVTQEKLAQMKKEAAAEVAITDADWTTIAATFNNVLED